MCPLPLCTHGERATQGRHHHHSPHHRLPHGHCTCRQMLPSINRLRSCNSLIRHSTYKQIEDCSKMPIQPTAAKLNTADGSPMTTLGSTALHLQIADFKFTHNFIICNQLPDMELIFDIDIQKKFSLSYTWDKD